MDEKQARLFKLGDVQFELMKIVWAKKQATVRDVYEEMLKRRKIAHSTVLTMLRELERKGLLVHDVDDRTYIYRPTQTRKRITTGILRDLIKRVFDGSAESLIASLVEDEEIGMDELKQMEEFIARKEQEISDSRTESQSGDGAEG